MEYSWITAEITLGESNKNSQNWTKLTSQSLALAEAIKAVNELAAGLMNH